MDTSLERIRTKIAELETKILDLRIAERELQSLEAPQARKTRTAPEPKPAVRPKRRGKPAAAEQAEPDEQPEARPQTIGAAITDALEQRGALSVAEIAEHIKAAGREINNRTVSFSLQALKKRNLVKSVDGKWTAPKARNKRAPA